MKKLIGFRFCVFVALACAVVMMNACGGGGSAPSTPPPTTPTFVLSGVVSGCGSAVTNVIVTVDGKSVTVAGDGSYSISGMANGNHTVTPILAGFSFNPTSATAVVNGANLSGVNFAATTTTYTISGTISGDAFAGISVAVGSNFATTNANGVFSSGGFSNGSYTVTPTLAGFSFNPTSATAVVSGNNATGVNFTATKIAVKHTIAVLYDYGLSGPSTIMVDDGQKGSVTVIVRDGYKIANTILSSVSGILSGTNFITGAVTSDGTIHFVGNSVDGGYRLNWIKVNPQILRVSQFTTTPITVQLSTYGNVNSVSLNYFTSEFDKNLPTNLQSLLMQDGGMSGGEHLFSLVLSTGTGVVPANPLRYYGNTVDALPYSIIAYDSSGKQLSDSGGSGGENGHRVDPQFQLGVVEDSIVDNTTVSQINPSDPSMFSASNVVNIVEPCSVDALGAATNSLQKYYPDVFNSVVSIASGCTYGFNGPQGGPETSLVSGIGLEVSSVSQTSSVLYSGVWETMDDTLLIAFPHEYGHSWGLYLNNNALNLTDSSAAHPSTFSSLFGVMSYGQYIVKQKDGNWLPTSPSDGVKPVCGHFSKLECYLAGFCPASDVPPTYIVFDYAKYQTPTPSEIPASDVSQVTINQIVSVYGPRVPAYPDTSKNVHIGFVVVSPSQADAAAMAFYNTIASYYADKEDTTVNSQGLFLECTPASLSVAMGGGITVDTTYPAHK